MSGISEPWGFFCWRPTLVWLELFAPHGVEGKKGLSVGCSQFTPSKWWGGGARWSKEKNKKSARGPHSEESLKELFCHKKKVVMTWWYAAHALNYLNESARFSITTRPFAAAAVKKNEWLKRLSSYLCTFLKKEFQCGTFKDPVVCEARLRCVFFFWIPAEYYMPVKAWLLKV